MAETLTVTEPDVRPTPTPASLPSERRSGPLPSHKAKRRYILVLTVLEFVILEKKVFYR